jgi:hypothetical protein
MLLKITRVYDNIVLADFDLPLLKIVDESSSAFEIVG